MNDLRQRALRCRAQLTERLQPYTEKLDGALQTGFDISLRTLKRAFMILTAVGAALLILLIVLLVCLVASVLGSLFIRWYVLLLAPGTELFTLSFNTMPLETEQWRLHKLNNMVSQLEPTRESPLLHRGDENSTASLVGLGGGVNANLVSVLQNEAAGLKMSLITKLVRNTVATSTLVIPSRVYRQVFLPHGGVSVEGLFKQRKPMFNARGVYAAKMQLVFAKEDIGREVSMFLESSMLMAKDPYISQSLGALDVLFKMDSSFTLITGEKPRSWPVELFMWSVSKFLCVPIWCYQKLAPLLNPDVFPMFDPETEVAVVTPVYSDFEPPLYLQPHLRAINFTLYQSEEGLQPKVRLRRLHLHTSVELSGLAYYFSNYAVSSFVGAAVLLQVLLGGAALVALVFVFIVGRSWGAELMQLNGDAPDDEGY
ncbi:uncharacterized protein TEOVI_000311200 [Trypanosoma equiperdum]|nr:hypothetical protein DPX39_040069400 [Trypanosoma brucei equiperdum]SCU71531.1 hypothetical protein, conserved [Trypanosoma equiperdum]